MRLLNWPARIVRTAFTLVVFCASACSDSTAPGPTRLTGQRLLASDQYGFWVWVPGKEEILFAPSFNSATVSSTRFEAISVPGGARRTVVPAPANGDYILGARFAIVGSHVYYHVLRSGAEATSFYRASVDGTGAPERILDVSPPKLSISPDERTAAWVEPAQSALQWSLVMRDIATGARRVYPLEQPGDRITWSPSGRIVVVDPENAVFSAGTPLQWVDLATGLIRVWLEPRPPVDNPPGRTIGWDGESPMDYVVAGDVVRYSLANGTREVLSAPAGSGTSVGWSADFTMVMVESTQCREVRSGIFGEYCATWVYSLDRISMGSGAMTNVLRYSGPTRPEILARPAPSGRWVGYENRSCGGSCNGLYAMRAP